MSVSHSFYIDTAIKIFDDDLLSELEKLVKEHKRLIKKHTFDGNHIYVEFYSQRPGAFYITTRPEDAYLNIIDKQLFTFCKYYNNKDNDLLCIFALLCKYYLRENLIISSDANCHYLGCEWSKAAEYLQNKGYDIKVWMNEDDENMSVSINGREVRNASLLNFEDTMAKMGWQLVRTDERQESANEKG